MNMRDKLSLAIRDAVLDNNGYIGTNDALKCADAVLDALMEPTDGMVDSANGMSVSGPYMGDDDVSDVFYTMIQAAKDGK